MKAKYNSKNNVLTFGKKGRIKFTPNLKNRDTDFSTFDVLSGLQMRISAKQKAHKSVWNIYALNAISSAMMFLHMKRLYGIAKVRKDAKDNKSKKHSKVSKKTKSNNR